MADPSPTAQDTAMTADTLVEHDPSMPRWVELQAAIDFDLWQLDQIRAAITARSPLDAEIDRSTGREAQLRADAEHLMARIDVLRAAYDQVTADPT